jgi:hypothetical protein
MKTLLLNLCLGTVALFAPVGACAPLMHVYLAELWCDAEGIEGDSKTLVIKGSMFPDICQVAQVTKEETHGRGAYEDIYTTDDPFQRGQRLHHYVDERRKMLVCDDGIAISIEGLGVSRPSKLLQMMEDQALYQRLTDPGRFAPIFEQVSEAENGSPIDGESVSKWNRHLHFYLSGSPVEFLRARAAAGESFWGVEPQELEQWAEWIPALIQEPKFQEHVSLLVDTFTSDFQFPKN